MNPAITKAEWGKIWEICDRKCLDDYCPESKRTLEKLEIPELDLY